jgi:hypothetical protein
LSYTAHIQVQALNYSTYFAAVEPEWWNGAARILSVEQSVALCIQEFGPIEETCTNRFVTVALGDWVDSRQGIALDSATDLAEFVWAERLEASVAHIQGLPIGLPLNVRINCDGKEVWSSREPLTLCLDGPNILEIDYAQLGSFFGQMRDQNGQAAIRTAVWVQRQRELGPAYFWLGQSPLWRTVTDDMGRFRINDVACG